VEQIRIALVDDRMLARLGLRSLLGGQPDLQVVGEAADFDEAVTLVKGTDPDVIIIDMMAQSLNIVELIRVLCEDDSPSRSILLLGNAADGQMREAIKVGANGSLLRQSTHSQLLSAIRLLASGYSLLVPSAVSQTMPVAAISVHTAQHGHRDGIARLTRRELDVLQLMSRGWSNVEISRALSLRETTVKSHTRSVLVKLGLRSRVQTVKFAYPAGLKATGRPLTAAGDSSGGGGDPTRCNGGGRQ
jgi:DNA-binding NarL/FixJ family response regulator